jgi:putative transport protein
MLLRAENRPPDEEESTGSASIVRRLVHVLHPKVAGKCLSDVPILSHSHCQASRVLVDGQLEPIPSDFRLAVGQHLLLVGTQPHVEMVMDYFGEESPHPILFLELEQHRRRVVATSKNVVGKSLRELHLRSQFGVTISRITRHDVEFVPDADEVIQFADALSAVGEPEDLERFISFAGHRERSFDETDLISLAFALLLGTLAGQVRFELGGDAISLGVAGGPLLVGLVMGHFGRLGPFVGHFPRASRLLLTETGLAMFLAQAGVQAGGQFATVLRDHGMILCVGAVSIAVAPLVVGVFITRYLIPLSGLQTLGAICGAMTSTPGLGAITSKVDSKVPATSYATVYPLALILMSILAPVLISLIS